MDFRKIFDIAGFITFAVISLIIFIFMYQKTNLLFDSALGGILGGAMCWLSYLTFRICYLASKKKD